MARLNYQRAARDQRMAEAISTNRPPTPKQLRFIKKLRQQRTAKVQMPTTSDEASAVIAKLLASPKKVRRS